MLLRNQKNKKYYVSKNFKIVKNDFKFINKFLEKKKIRFYKQKIIDIACGNGSFLHFLKKKYPNNLYFGLDHDNFLISLNKKNPLLKDIIFFKKNILKKFSKNKYNVVTCLGSLNLFKNQESILKKLLNSLNKKGFLIMNLYLNKNNIDVSINFKKYIKKKQYINGGLYIYSYRAIKNFFLKKNLSSFYIIPNPYPSVIKKKNPLNIYTLKFGRNNF